MCWVVYLFSAAQLAWPLRSSLKEIPYPLTSTWIQPMASPSGDWRKEERLFISLLLDILFLGVFFLGHVLPQGPQQGQMRMRQVRSWVWNSRGHSVSGLCKGGADTPESKVLVAQPCPTLCHLMDCSLPGSFVRGIQIWWLIPYIYLSFYWGDSVPYNQSSTEQNSEGTEAWEVAGEYLVVLNEIWILGPRSITFWVGQAT